MRGYQAGILAATLALAAPAAAATMDCSKGAIWTGAAAGFINGVPYTVDGVAHAPMAMRQEGRNKFNDYHFYLSSKAGQMFDMTLITIDGVKPDGQTMTIGLHGDGSDAAPGARNIQNWTLEDKAKKFKLLYFSVSDATMQIVFGTRKGASLPVQIHFCIPSKRTEIAGHFTVSMN